MGARESRSSPEPYPYTDEEVFRAGYERGREFARLAGGTGELEALVAEEKKTRRLSLYDVTKEGLVLLGMEAAFEPRSLFEAGVRRALEERNW